ncbi:YihY/virulence factor BrkB family protein [Phycicoccus flavus]|uniref:YihY/virulence factor BrkB family protein n=1 Tax=Phycicoccus flavus TaxID=2502783 RepID=A0A8T6R7Q5_9MICO|nr:YihY/virulence factor BrkB family protein [Phycicoccus flavus]NHA68865.1 YihY/virulence factor BrkB family protein [Phycicoccus flavus]
MTTSTIPRAPVARSHLGRPAWLYVIRRSVHEFSRDRCTDLAAGLTYYGVLSLFPAAIALVSVVGLVGQGQAAVRTLTGILRDVGAGSVATTVQPVLMSLAQTHRAGTAFGIGLLAALWSASGYVASFGRAMNVVYDVGEGRPAWTLRPQMLLVTLAAVALVALVAVGLVVSGPVASAVGRALGLGSTVVLVWEVAKWPVVLVAVAVVVALLYFATPNVRQRFRWVSTGALFAIGVWALASAAFGVYVTGFSHYDRTYGSLAGVVVFLLWLWITNLALLFGAELDAELERGRELQAGIPAEETVQLPLRDDRGIRKSEATLADDVGRGAVLRGSAGARES